MNNQRFCPDCGSENVNPDFRRTNVLGEMMFNTNKWLCNDCGYAGLMPQRSQTGEDRAESQSEDLKSSGEASKKQNLEFDTVSQHELVDSNAGSAYFKYFVYISLPASIIYLLYTILI